MSIIGDLVLDAIVWLFGWYLFIIGGIVLIVLGIYFSFVLLIILGAILLIDGIAGLLLRRKFGKKDGDRIAGSVGILSFGVMFILVDLYYFSSDLYLFTIIGLALILIGAISLLFTIRKQLKLKSLLKNDVISRESKIEQSVKDGLTETKARDVRSVEDIIYDYLKENGGKAFTSKSIYNRCKEIKEFDLTFSDIKKILDNLNRMGEIGSHIKEEEIYYHAL